MWITVLAMNTRTAETSTGSQSADSAVIGASFSRTAWVVLHAAGCRILLVEKCELSIQLRPVSREHGRFGEESLAHHGEELGRVLSGVGVDEGRLAGIHLGTEALVGALEGLAPFRRLHSVPGSRVILVPSAVHMDLVCELVDDDVVAALGQADVLPGEDHRSARPGLTREFLVEAVDDAVFVDLLLLHAEFPGVDDHS